MSHKRNGIQCINRWIFKGNDKRTPGSSRRYRIQRKSNIETQSGQQCDATPSPPNQGKAFQPPNTEGVSSARSLHFARKTMDYRTVMYTLIIILASVCCTGVHAEDGIVPASLITPLPLVTKIISRNITTHPDQIMPTSGQNLDVREDNLDTNNTTLPTTSSESVPGNDTSSREASETVVPNEEERQTPPIHTPTISRQKRYYEDLELEAKLKREREQAARQWAPTIWLHSEELYFPTDVHKFLANVETSGTAWERDGKSGRLFKTLPSGRESEELYLSAPVDTDCHNCPLPEFLHGDLPSDGVGAPVYVHITSCYSPMEEDISARRSRSARLRQSGGLLHRLRQWRLGRMFSTGRWRGKREAMEPKERSPFADISAEPSFKLFRNSPSANNTGTSSLIASSNEEDTNENVDTQSYYSADKTQAALHETYIKHKDPIKKLSKSYVAKKKQFFDDKESDNNIEKELTNNVIDNSVEISTDPGITLAAVTDSDTSFPQDDEYSSEKIITTTTLPSNEHVGQRSVMNDTEEKPNNEKLLLVSFKIKSTTTTQAQEPTSSTTEENIYSSQSSLRSQGKRHIDTRQQTVLNGFLNGPLRTVAPPHELYGGGSQPFAGSNQFVRKEGPTYGHHFTITYWFFYPFNRGKDVCTSNMWLVGRVAKPLFKGRCLGQNIVVGNHVGDWEHISIFFEHGQAKHMYISSHNFGGYYTYRPLIGKFEYVSQDVRKGLPVRVSYPQHLSIVDGRLVLYSALGSHGVWPTAGNHMYNSFMVPLSDETDEGYRWDTWNNMEIIDIKENQNDTIVGLHRQWLLYKGHWGNPSNNCHPGLLGFCEVKGGPTGITTKRNNFPCSNLNHYTFPKS